MCVIFIAHQRHPRHPLIVLANRDEFYNRPTAAPARWEDHPHVTAGRDLVAGGTWLGVTDGGRFAAVTNYRDPNAPPGPLSRGRLVADFLIGEDKAQTYMNRVAGNSDQYSGFNLLVGEISKGGNDLFYFSNRGDGIRKLEPGVYGLSNHLLDTAWPKVSTGVERFIKIISKPQVSKSECFALLADANVAADVDLPDTGVGTDRERVLSPIFIRTPTYGTRSSTVVMFDNDSGFDFEERVSV
jgi:uncharacterized protein with NRDE domain